MEAKTLEGLQSLLSRQVNHIIKTRFKVSGINQSEVENMLCSCYEANVIKRRADFKLDEATKTRIRKAAKWLTGDFKPGLLIYGGACGTGKTTMAAAICDLVNYLYDSAYSNERKSVYRVTAINLVKAYSENPELYRRYVNQELLFIDDVGTEPSSIKIYGNEFSPLTELLYTRYDRMSWTILTSNLTDDQINDRYGTRIYDRLKEMVERMHFDGASYRK